MQITLNRMTKTVEADENGRYNFTDIWCDFELTAPSLSKELGKKLTDYLVEHGYMVIEHSQDETNLLMSQEGLTLVCLTLCPDFLVSTLTALPASVISKLSATFATHDTCNQSN